MEPLKEVLPSVPIPVPHYPRLQVFCGVAAALLGAGALVGWLAGARALTSFTSMSIPMAPNTALALMALGTSVAVLARASLPRWAVEGIRVAAGLVAILVSLRLCEFLPGVALDTDRWFFALPSEPFHQALTGRMAYQTAACFLLASIAILVLASRTRRPLTVPSPPDQGGQARVRGRQAGGGTMAGVLSCLVTATGLIFFLGYLYGAPFFSQTANIPMSLNTSLALIFVGVGLIAMTGPDAFPLRRLSGPSVHARLLRAFLPFTGVTVCVVAWLMHFTSLYEDAASAALLSAFLVVAALFPVSMICARIARSAGADLERAEQELRQAERRSRSYAEELQTLNATLEQRVAERTAELADSRDRLDQFFTITTAMQDPDNVEKTFDLVLRFCQRLGYEGAMLSLVDREAKVVRAVRAAGMLSGILPRTVRPLEGSDILAIVAREGRTAVVNDALQDSRCDQAAVAGSGVRGQIAAPLLSAGEVVGTLQVVARTILTPTDEDVRTLETLAGQSARALAGLLRLKEIQRLNQELKEQNERLQQLADDLAATALSEGQAFRALRASEERFRLILDTAYEAFIIMDADGLIKTWNTQAERTFGWPTEEVLGRSVAETILPPQHREAHVRGLQHFLATGEGPVLNRRIELSAVHKDGHELPVELTITPIRQGQTYIFGSFLHDITERKQAEKTLRVQNALLQEMAQSERQAHEALKKAQAQLVQTEKLAALGQLVAGVAHEINNPLSFVSNNVAVLQRDLAVLRDLLNMYRETEVVLEKHEIELCSRIRDFTERIDLEYTVANLDGLLSRSRDGLKRIQQIVKDLRDFARLDESDLHEVDLSAGIESTLNIIQGQARRQQVGLELDLVPLPAVTCYPAKINQVVLNLVTNAIDACSPGGKVTVGTRSASDGVEIFVSDTGRGIDPAIREKIFDPFFTTKPQGKGTGLGLSISYGIVQTHGGTIDFESAVGQGTRFVVRLPRKPPLAAGADHGTRRSADKETRRQQG